MTVHKVAYISGPIAGHEALNEPLFRAAERRLVSKHNQASHRYDLVLVPHDIPPYGHEGPCPPSYVKNGEHTAACYLRTDLSTMLSYATDVWFLPGWQASVGARLEMQVAAACGLGIHFFHQRDLGCAHNDYSQGRCEEELCWNWRKGHRWVTPADVRAAMYRTNATLAALHGAMDGELIARDKGSGNVDYFACAHPLRGMSREAHCSTPHCPNYYGRFSGA